MRIFPVIPASNILMPMTTETDHPAAEPLLAICLFAAYADGGKSDEETARIEALAAELGGQDASSISRRILMGRLSMDAAVAGLAEPRDRMLAYEMARAVCEAGGSISAAEQAFLDELRSKLALPGNEVAEVDRQVDTIAQAPLESPEPAAADVSPMILRYSILNGALELLPETMATLAILPLQMKMVWRIGKAHGHELDRSSIKEFLATAGIGMGSQVVEGFARKFIGGFGKKLGGKLAGRIANEATGSLFSFASTYAIGHLALKYYAGGRTLGGMEIRSLYTPLVDQARQIHERHFPEIRQRAAGLNTSSIIDLVRGKAAV